MEKDEQKGAADDGDRRSEAERTARIAVLAGLPGLSLVTVAALSANSLALLADLVLSVLDMAVLATAWLVARRRRTSTGAGDGGSARAQARAEHLAGTLAAFCMMLSMSVVVWAALSRIGAGGAEPEGPGVVIGMALNGVYAVINGWILVRWRRRMKAHPSPFVRAQVCLFWDKLSTNLIISMSLALGIGSAGSPLAPYVDPVAGLLIAAATARWATPVIRDSLRGLAIVRQRRRRRRELALGMA